MRLIKSTIANRFMDTLRLTEENYYVALEKAANSVSRKQTLVLQQADLLDAPKNPRIREYHAK